MRERESVENTLPWTRVSILCGFRQQKEAKFTRQASTYLLDYYKVAAEWNQNLLCSFGLASELFKHLIKDKICWVLPLYGATFLTIKHWNLDSNNQVMMMQRTNFSNVQKQCLWGATKGSIIVCPTGGLILMSIRVLKISLLDCWTQ